MWCLIVSIPDLYRLSYFDKCLQNIMDNLDEYQKISKKLNDYYSCICQEEINIMLDMCSLS